MSVYLDHNAASPMHAEVLDAMLPFYGNPAGIPSSLHGYGQSARSALEPARLDIGRCEHHFGNDNCLQHVDKLVSNLQHPAGSLPAMVRRAAG